MTAPKEQRAVSIFLSLSLFIPVVPASTSHAALGGGDQYFQGNDSTADLEKFKCKRVEYDFSDNPAVMEKIRRKEIKPPVFYMRDTGRVFRAEGNKQRRLYENDRCTIGLSAHLFAKNKQAFLHWASEVDEKAPDDKTPVKPFEFKALPVNQTNWKLTGEGRDVDLSEKKPDVVRKPEVDVPMPDDGSQHGDETGDEQINDGDLASIGDHRSLVKYLTRIILKNKSYDSDIKKQLRAYIWTDEHGFIKEKTEQNGLKDEAAFDASVGVKLDEWVDKHLESARAAYTSATGSGAEDPQIDKSALEITAMYFIVSSGKTGVFSGDKLKKFDEKRKTFKTTLLDCLSPYRAKKNPMDPKAAGEVCHPVKQTDKPNQLVGSAKGEDWLRGFLSVSTKSSWLIVWATRMTPEEIERINRENPSEVHVPDGTGGRRPGEIPKTSPAFNADYLFGKWGDANVFSLDGRKLAVVPRLVRTFDKSHNSVYVQKIGVYDISSPGNIYGKLYDLDVVQDKKFSFYPGGKQYMLNITAIDGSNDTAISIKRPDGTEPVFGIKDAKMPTVNELFKMRAEKAMSSGLVSEIGGKKFYVTAESAATGYYMYWSQETIQKMLDGKMAGRDVLPDGAADINKVANNRVVPVGDSTPTGLKVGNKWYDLQRDPVTGVWTPVEGKAPEPTPEPAQPSTGSGNQPASKPDSRTGAKTWGDIPGFDTNYKGLDAVNAQLDAKDLHIYRTAPKEGDGNIFYLIHREHGGTPVPVPADGNKPGKAASYSFKVKDHMLIGEFETGIAYIDVSRGVRETSAGGKWNQLYESGMWTKASDFSAFEGPDPAALDDALGRMDDFKNDRAAIQKNALSVIQKHPDGTFITKAKKITYEGKGIKIEIWPDYKPDAPVNGGDAVSGIAFDGVAQGQAGAADFDKAPGLKIDGVAPDGYEKILQTEHAVLYKGHIGEKKEGATVAVKAKSVWWLKFKILPKEGEYAVSSWIKLFEDPPGDKKDSTDRGKFPGGQAITLRALDLSKTKDVPMPVDWKKESVMPPQGRIVKTDKPIEEEGALAVYNRTAAQDRDKNLIGVVAFWGKGMTLEKAEAAAKK